MAHENCRGSAYRPIKFIEALDMKVPASAATAWPRVISQGETTYTLMWTKIRLVPVPPAHTDGDIFVHFEKADVIHAGDLSSMAGIHSSIIRPAAGSAE